MKPSGPTFDAKWRARCRVCVATRRQVELLIARHYIGKWPGVCVLILAMECARESWGLLKHKPTIDGVIVFALPPRESVKRYGGETWELARLYIDDSVPANAETWFIGKAIRHIKRHHRNVKVLVSYADPSAGHSGTIYRASNWIADGRTDDDRKTPRFDYACGDTGKRYSRRGHVPDGTNLVRVPRVSKHRFIYRLSA